MLTERAADQVQRDRVDARVAVAQAEADDAEHVPEDVVLLRGPRVVVEPQHEHVVGQEAHGEHQHERQHGLGHLLPGAHLPHLSLPTGQTHTAIIGAVNVLLFFIIIKVISWFFFRKGVYLYKVNNSGGGGGRRILSPVTLRSAGVPAVISILRSFFTRFNVVFQSFPEKTRVHNMFVLYSRRTRRLHTFNASG